MQRIVSKELNEAYDVLSDANKRAQYDRFGTIPGAAGGPAGGYNVDFEDIFGGGFSAAWAIFSRASSAALRAVAPRCAKKAAIWALACV